MIDVAIPEQPRASSSTTRHESTRERPTPSYSGGIEMHESPNSHACFMTSWGKSPL